MVMVSAAAVVTQTVLAQPTVPDATTPAAEAAPPAAVVPSAEAVEAPAAVTPPPVTAPSAVPEVAPAPAAEQPLATDFNSIASRLKAMSAEYKNPATTDERRTELAKPIVEDRIRLVQTPEAIQLLGGLLPTSAAEKAATHVSQSEAVDLIESRTKFNTRLGANSATINNQVQELTGLSAHELFKDAAKYRQEELFVSNQQAAEFKQEQAVASRAKLTDTQRAFLEQEERNNPKAAAQPAAPVSTRAPEKREIPEYLKISNAEVALPEADVASTPAATSAKSVAVPAPVNPAYSQDVVNQHINSLNEEQFNELLGAIAARKDAEANGTFTAVPKPLNEIKTAAELVNSKSSEGFAMIEAAAFNRLQESSNQAVDNLSQKSFGEVITAVTARKEAEAAGTFVQTPLPQNLNRNITAAEAINSKSAEDFTFIDKAVARRLAAEAAAAQQ